MQLDAYLREKKLTDEAFASALGADVSAWGVRKWRYGQRIPRLGMQQRISVATDGVVTANDFVAAAIAADLRREEAAPPASTQPEVAA